MKMMTASVTANIPLTKLDLPWVNNNRLLVDHETRFSLCVSVFSSDRV